MWYEDLRPFGATEIEIFGFVESVCNGSPLPHEAQVWLADGQPFAILFHALYLCPSAASYSLSAEVERAATAAPQSPIVGVVAGFVLGVMEQPDLARRHLDRVNASMTVEAVEAAARISSEMDEAPGMNLVLETPWATAFREEYLLKLGRAAGLVAPVYCVDGGEESDNLRFLFRLAKFRGDLKEAAAIAKRLSNESEQSSVVRQELEHLGQEAAFIRAMKLWEGVEQENKAAGTQKVDVVTADGEGDSSLEDSFEAVTRGLQSFMAGEAEDGEMHRILAVIKAEIAKSTQDWSLLENMASRAQKTWPGHEIWGEYARTAKIYRLFNSYQGYERAGDDEKAWNMLEELMGLPSTNPNFAESADNFRYVIPGGRETEVRALFAPFAAGQALGEGRFVNIEVGENWIKAHVLQEDGTRACLVLEHPTSVGKGSTMIPSFSMRFKGKAGTKGIGNALRSLAAAVVENAPGDFPWVAASFGDIDGS